MANQLLNNVVHSLCEWGGESATWPQGPNIASFAIKENQEWKENNLRLGSGENLLETENDNAAHHVYAEEEMLSGAL